MKKMLLTLCGGLLLAGVAVAQDTTTPSNAPPPQDQPTASPAPETAAPAAQPQAQPPARQTPNQPTSADTPATASPGGNTPKIAPGSVIPAQLAKSVDAKKAKTGDEVVARVTQDMKANSGEVIVPKDTKMIGHVTEAQAHSKEQKQSQVGISFDHAVMKDGTNMPLPMSIQAIIAPPSANPGGAADDQGAPPAPQGTAGGAGQTARPASTTGTPSAGGTAAASDAQASPAARPQITGQTQGVVGISNLSLSPTPDPTMGSVVSSDKNNVKLDSGILLLLRVNP
jgi:hypothetical protein